MYCVDIQSRFGDFIAGQLARHEREQVLAHLQECEACRTTLGNVDRLAAILSQTECPPVPSRLTARIMAAAGKRRSESVTADWNPLKWWRGATAPMQAAATITMIIGLGLGCILGWTSTSSPSSAATGAKSEPLDIYQLDFLGDLPSGSLAGSYLALIAVTSEGGH